MSNGKFKTKVHEVDAMQLTDTNAMDVYGWLMSFPDAIPAANNAVVIRPVDGSMNFMTANGVQSVYPGDWIAYSDVNGFSVHDDETFQASYEAEADPAP